MDTRLTYTSPEQVSQRAAEALEMVRSFAPDVLFVTDDNALKEVAVSYALENPAAPVPVVFSGVNVDTPASTSLSRAWTRPEDRSPGCWSGYPTMRSSSLGSAYSPTRPRW